MGVNIQYSFLNKCKLTDAMMSMSMQAEPFDQKIQKTVECFEGGIQLKSNSRMTDCVRLLMYPFTGQSINCIPVIKHGKFDHLNNHAFGSRCKRRTISI